MYWIALEQSIERFWQLSYVVVYTEQTLIHVKHTFVEASSRFFLDFLCQFLNFANAVHKWFVMRFSLDYCLEKLYFV